MFDNTNPYELKKISRDGKTIYVAIFENGTGQKAESEVSQSVANALFGTFVKKERNLRRSDERHLEQSEMSEQTLHQRVCNATKSLEEEIDIKLRNEQLCEAIAKLPEIQKRRLILYYFEGFTYEQIAGIEGCKKMAVKFSIDTAKEKIKNLFLK